MTYLVSDESAHCGLRIVRDHLVEQEQIELDNGTGRFRIIK